MNAAEHYRAAERLAQEADEWMDVDWGWKGELSSEERIARRNSDLAAAHVHATLALVDQQARAGVVEAVVYCGHDGCGLPDGHLSEHATGPRAERTWNDPAGDSVTIDDLDDMCGPAVALWLMNKVGQPLDSVHLTPAQARELADDLHARADQLDGGAR